MTDKVNKPVPSDLTIPLNYVALKPGVYKPRQPLIKDSGFTTNEMKYYQVPTGMALGIGDESSAVFVYRQGTIEVVGKVYHGGRLVKPGIYSVFEKLRYLQDGSEVIPFDDSTLNNRRTPYNQTLRIANEYVKQYRNAKTNSIIEYVYVDYDTQITTTQGDKSYPIPILNGKLRLYPDGSFEIENIVVRSTDGRQYNEVGYLGDHENNTSTQVFFNDVTKDDINPFNVYQLLEEHDDGSITYGAVPVNQNLTSDRFAILPPGIIPVNDGKVTIDNLGIMYLEGTVINGDGYRIIVDTLTPYELQRINQVKSKAPEELTEDYLARLSHMIDRSYIWNPTDTQQRIYVVNTPYNNVQYQYHPVNESYTTHRNDDGELVATYHALPNWDSFIPLDVSKLKLTQSQWNIGIYPSNYNYNGLLYTFKHWDSVVSQIKREYALGSSEVIDSNVFPLRLNDIYQIGKKTIHPKYRISPTGSFEYYTTIDHTRLLDQAELAYNAHYIAKQNNKHPNQVYTLHQQPKHQRWVNVGYDLNNATKIELDTTERNIKNLFVPYIFPTETLTGTFDNQLTDNRIIIEEIPENERQDDDPSIYRITVQGHVIWKRNSKYYTLKPGTTYLDDSWPDIVDKDGNPAELFSVNGYFHQEPIFIRRWEDTHLTIGNEVDTLDGIQRQEKGLFRLVSRDVTLYLSDYDKSLIDNLHGHYLENEYNEVTGYIDYRSGYYLGIPYTAKDTGIHLAYHGFKPNSLLPMGVQDVSLLTLTGTATAPPKKYAKPIDAAKEYTRLFSYDKNHFTMIPYVNLWLQLFPTGTNKNIFALSLQKAKTAGYSIVNIDATRKLALETAYTETYINTDTLKYTIMPEYTNLLHDPIYLYSKLYDIILPQYMLVTEDVQYVEGRGTPGVTVIYHEHNDLETTTGEIIIGSNGRFRIPPPSAIDDLYGYTEVYIDEPFNQTPNIHKVFWRGPNHQDGNYTKPLALRDAEKITNNTTVLYGSGEYLSEIELYSPDNVLTPMSVVTVDELGNWSIPLSPRLQSRKTYQITMKTVWGTSETITFTVGLSRLTWDDIISPMDLFGKDVYAAPVSVRVRGNTITNIESKITFDVETQQYTIHGLVGYQPNNDISAYPVIFEEGTYNFGVTPPVITAKYLHAYGVNGALLNATPMTYQDNQPCYIIDSNGVPPILIVEVDNVGLTKGTWTFANRQVTAPYSELGYLIPKVTRDTYINYINQYTDETWLAKHPIITKAVAIEFITQLEKYINPNCLVSSYIGVVQNKLYVVGSMSFILPGNSQPLYLYNEGSPGTSDRLYFTPERLFNSLRQVKPWFENSDNVLSSFTRELITNGLVVETKTLSYFIDDGESEFVEGIGNSIIAGNASNRVVTGRVLFKRRSDIVTTTLGGYRYKLDDRELYFPVDKFVGNPLAVEHLEEWESIIDLEDNQVDKVTLTNKVYVDVRTQPIFAYMAYNPYREDSRYSNLTMENGVGLTLRDAVQLEHYVIGIYNSTLEKVRKAGLDMDTLSIRLLLKRKEDEFTNLSTETVLELTTLKHMKPDPVNPSEITLYSFAAKPEWMMMLPYGATYQRGNRYGAIVGNAKAVTDKADYYNSEVFDLTVNDEDNLNSIKTKTTREGFTNRVANTLGLPSFPENTVLYSTFQIVDGNGKVYRETFKMETTFTKPTYFETVFLSQFDLSAVGAWLGKMADMKIISPMISRGGSGTYIGGRDTGSKCTKVDIDILDANASYSLNLTPLATYSLNIYRDLFQHLFNRVIGWNVYGVGDTSYGADIGGTYGTQYRWLRFLPTSLTKPVINQSALRRFTERPVDITWNDIVHEDTLLPLHDFNEMPSYILNGDKIVLGSNDDTNIDPTPANALYQAGVRDVYLLIKVSYDDTTYGDLYKRPIDHQYHRYNKPYATLLPARIMSTAEIKNYFNSLPNGVNP